MRNMKKSYSISLLTREMLKENKIPLYANSIDNNEKMDNIKCIEVMRKGNSQRQQ